MLLKSLSLKSVLFFAVPLVLLLILPPVLPRFYTYILTLIFVTALLAMSLNMVVGHGGLFQFHHGAFYGVGAYAFALLLYKAHLPMWLGYIAAPLIAGFAGLLIGWFCVRLTSLYFGMLQISLGSLLWAIVFRWYSLTNGDDDPLGQDSDWGLSVVTDTIRRQNKVELYGIGIFDDNVRRYYGKNAQVIESAAGLEKALIKTLSEHVLIS